MRKPPGAEHNTHSHAVGCCFSLPRAAERRCRDSRAAHSGARLPGPDARAPTESQIKHHATQQIVKLLLFCICCLALRCVGGRAFRTCAQTAQTACGLHCAPTCSWLCVWCALRTGSCMGALRVWSHLLCAWARSKCFFPHGHANLGTTEC